ncbi:hypothetical protein [Saccharothrix obliqua]|uniref:hypothetical protein n=1 Tax=Saccharothrix obliqua TaxID=2861747 RepID=UPI001C5E844F|nr:hypothetical protein [Saccharothrix obliqua]MBW4718434.1 hypothetical protein [Saccharothrix obliqua]
MDNNTYWLKRAVAERTAAFDWAPVVWSAERACCCAAEPSVVVLVTPPGADHAVDLLLCRHHHERSRAALAGVAVFDVGGPVHDATRVVHQAVPLGWW